VIPDLQLCAVQSIDPEAFRAGGDGVFQDMIILSRAVPFTSVYGLDAITVVSFLISKGLLPPWPEVWFE
jgi:hypothetical protein